MKSMLKKIFLFFSIFFFPSLFGNMPILRFKGLMKILMIVPKFPKIHDICMLNQMTGLIDRGHDVHIYALSKGDCVKVQEDVIKYDLINKTFFEQLPPSLDAYDIVIFQLGHKLFNIKKMNNFKGKVVVCLRGYDLTGFLREYPNFYDKYFDSCDLFMPVCKAFKKILEQEGCNPDRIIVHHSAIDCSRFTFKVRKLPRNGTINIVSAGRFIEKKGFVYAIRAIARLIKKYPQIRYTIIGDGLLKKKYKKLIKQLNVQDKIKIDCWHTHQEYINILNKSHIFVVPSVTAENNDQEGIPNVLKEAMAMGLLVVATDHSGNLELIENLKSGFVVSERNSNAIYKAIERIINSPEKWLSIQLAAVYKVHSEFEKEKENDKLEAILHNLLEQE